MTDAMDCERQVLEVCVCGAAQGGAAVGLLLHSLAAGHLLGPRQHVRIRLQDGAVNTMELEEVAMDLQDSCYSLLMGVQAMTDMDKSLSCSDIVLLVLTASQLEDLLTEVANYATALSRVVRTKQRAVIVVGQHALTATGVLDALTPQLTPHLVTAVPLPLSRYSQSGGGGYLLAQTISEHVQSWWSRLQTRDSMPQRDTLTTQGGLCNSSSMPVSCLLSPPIRLWLKQKGSGSPWPESPEWEHIRQILNDVNAAVHKLGISNTQLLSNSLNCQL